MNRIIFEDMKDIESRGQCWDWLKGKTVLITGAYGMLVSYMVYFLIYLNETYPTMNIRILAIGRSMEKMRKRFGKYVDREYFCTCNVDICAPLELNAPVDYIVHAASLASAQYYGVNPTGTLLPNSVGTYHLLELAREKGAQGFLFFSSGDVYGKVSETLEQITESDYGYIDPINIRNCYGESKRMGENMCKAWAEQYGVPAKSVRIFHTYGPTMDIDHDQRVFAEFVRNIVYNMDIVMKSDGSATRPFCYLADATDAFFRILKNGQPGDAYNMCNNDGLVSVKELAEQLVALYPEKGLKVVIQQRDKDTAYIESFVKKVTPVNVRKLMDMGWYPKYDLETGFKRTVENFIN